MLYTTLKGQLKVTKVSFDVWSINQLIPVDSMFFFFNLEYCFKVFCFSHSLLSNFVRRKSGIETNSQRQFRGGTIPVQNWVGKICNFPAWGSKSRCAITDKTSKMTTFGTGQKETVICESICHLQETICLMNGTRQGAMI